MWSSFWSPGASRPSAGCARRASASFPSTAARHSRSRASSSSVAGLRSRPSAAGLVSSRCWPRPQPSAASRSAIRRARSSSCPTACAWKACAFVTTAWKATCPASRWWLPAAGLKPIPEWRTRYLGPGWDLAKVRGPRFTTGDGIRMAMDIGASPCGNWSGCHAVQWEMNAPEFGDLAVGDQFQKHSYPFAILINAQGKRFVDEGADFRNYTYAKYGRVVLEQPGQFAWQI